MELENHVYLNQIENCPALNDKGSMRLYRCVQNPMGESSFEPLAVTKSKYKSSCLHWGLSTYRSLNAAKDQLNNLSKKKQSIYNAIAEYTVEEVDGIKHQSLANKFHYTFYPIKGFDFVTKFKLVQDEN